MAVKQHVSKGYDVDKVKKLLLAGKSRRDEKLAQLEKSRVEIEAAYARGMSVRQIYKCLRAGGFHGSLTFFSSVLSEWGVKRRCQQRSDSEENIGRFSNEEKITTIMTPDEISDEIFAEIGAARKAIADSESR